jgi:polyhydroxyalkanoate synthesis regulator phasin
MELREGNTMRRGRNLEDARTVSIYPEIVECPKCSSPLGSAYRKKRFIVKLTEIVEVISHTLRCTNAACTLANCAIKPEQESAMALRGHTFGIDVLSLIGKRRFKDNRSIPDIHKELLQTYRLDISEREVEYLAEEYLALVSIIAKEDKELMEKLRKQGVIILSIDGVQPEKGNETLYILRDIISGSVLVARNLISSATSEIEKLLREVEQLGIPIKGVVSDKQQSIVLAVANVFKDIPHQYCQFHYIRDASLPIVEEDRNLCRELRKKIRGVTDIERSIERFKEEMSEQHRDALKDLCVAIRTVMNLDGKYPLQPRGLRLFERLSDIRDTVESMRRKEDHTILQRFSRMLGKLSDFRSRYLDLLACFNALLEVVKLLEVKNGEMTEESARTRLQTFVQALSARDDLPKEWREHLLKTTNAFAPGLFSYLRDSRLPRTNNEMETFIGSMKMAARKMGGRRNIQRFILRSGHAVAVLRGLPKTFEIEPKIPNVPEAQFKLVLAMLRRRTLRSKEYRAKRDIKEFLNGVAQQW